MYSPTAQNDVRILHALANPVRYEVIVQLLDRPATQKALGERLELSSGVLSRHMATLTKAGLVAREKSHGAYAVRFPEAMVAVLSALAALQMEHAGANAADAVRRAHIFESAQL